MPKGIESPLYLMNGLLVDEPRRYGLQRLKRDAQRGDIIQKVDPEWLKDECLAPAEAPMVLARGWRSWGATSCWRILAKALVLAHDQR